MRHARVERLPAAVEVWLLQIRAVIFGAKRVAVAAVVAIVGKVRDLIRFFRVV